MGTWWGWNSDCAPTPCQSVLMMKYCKVVHNSAAVHGTQKISLPRSLLKNDEASWHFSGEKMALKWCVYVWVCFISLACPWILIPLQRLADFPLSLPAVFYFIFHDYRSKRSGVSLLCTSSRKRNSKAFLREENSWKLFKMACLWCLP